MRPRELVDMLRTQVLWLAAEDVRGISSVGRASGWQPEGQGFKSPILHFRKTAANPEDFLIFRDTCVSAVWLDYLRST
jgi:hypothetical protein